MNDPLISYAQNFEDVMLWRALGHVEGGFYIDIGAQDPVVDSVSLAFYEHGWRGVHVEPTAHYADQLRRARPDETVIQAAVGRQGGILEFFEVVDTGLSTGDRRIAEQHRQGGFSVRSTDVPCITLASILDRFADRDIHWLKIDVEGLEKEVLDGWAPSAVRPWIVVVESTAPMTQIETHGQWEPLLLDLGYRPVYFDGLNRFYLAPAQAHLAEKFGVGPNYFDDFVLSGSGGRFCSLLNARLREREEETRRVACSLSTTEGQLAHSRQETAHFRSESERLFAEMERGSREFAAERQRLTAELHRQDREFAAERQQLTDQNTRLQDELGWVYGSRSWRITRPVRAAGTAVRRLRNLLRAAPRRLAGPALGAGLAYFRAHPGQKQLLVRLIGVIPGLPQRLQQMAARRAAAELPPLPTPDPVALDPANHPASVRRTYAQLRQMRRRAR